MSKENNWKLLKTYLDDYKDLMKYSYKELREKSSEEEEASPRDPSAPLDCEGIFIEATLEYKGKKMKKKIKKLSR